MVNTAKLHKNNSDLSPKQYDEIVDTLNRYYKTNAFYSLGNCMGLNYKDGKDLAIPPAYLLDLDFKAILDNQSKLKLF